MDCDFKVRGKTYHLTSRTGIVVDIDKHVSGSIQSSAVSGQVSGGTTTTKTLYVIEESGTEFQVPPLNDFDGVWQGRAGHMITVVSTGNEAGKSLYTNIYNHNLQKWLSSNKNTMKFYPRLMPDFVFWVMAAALGFGLTPVLINLLGTNIEALVLAHAPWVSWVVVIILWAWRNAHGYLKKHSEALAQLKSDIEAMPIRTA